jgi:hypothetical protein
VLLSEPDTEANEGNLATAFIIRLAGNDCFVLCKPIRKSLFAAAREIVPHQFSSRRKVAMPYGFWTTAR